jgi:hypothetical protein
MTVTEPPPEPPLLLIRIQLLPQPMALADARWPEATASPARAISATATTVS